MTQDSRSRVIDRECGGSVSPPSLSFAICSKVAMLAATSSYVQEPRLNGGTINSTPTNQICTRDTSTMTSVAPERSAVITPAPMTLPAILQNPKSKTQAQVESYAAQQRERAQALARKHLDDKHGDRTSGVDRRKGEGKRSLRRRENGEHSRGCDAFEIDLKNLLSYAGS
jgi:hypothetical protein